MIKLHRNNRQKIYRVIFWILLGGGLTWSLYSFSINEGSRLLKFLMVLLAVWAIYLALRAKREFMVILTGFLITANIFHALDFGLLPSWLATVVFVSVYLLLFYFFHNQDPKGIFDKDWRIKAAYAGLVALVSTEFFLILKFFPVDEKNRAMMLILVLWYFNQIYHFNNLKKLSTGVLINLTGSFLLIFGVILYTLPFLGR